MKLKEINIGGINCRRTLAGRRIPDLDGFVTGPRRKPAVAWTMRATRPTSLWPTSVVIRVAVRRVPDYDELHHGSRMRAGRRLTMQPIRPTHGGPSVWLWHMAGRGVPDLNGLIINQDKPAVAGQCN